MENKKNDSTLERALLLKVREAVNSQEEYEWVEAELARLNSVKLAAHDEWHAEQGCLDWQRIEYYLGFAAAVAVEAVITPRLTQAKAGENPQVLSLPRRIP
jgi:hypothetical protein